MSDNEQKLKVYLETSFVNYLANPHTLPKTRSIVTAEGYVCPAVMTPKTFIENTQLETGYV